MPPLQASQKSKEVLQNDATPPRSMQLSTSHGCRGALCAPAGDETSPLRILLITFSFLQQTHIPHMKLQTGAKALSFQYFFAPGALIAFRAL